jgi:hypothetical protein
MSEIEINTGLNVTSRLFLSDINEIWIFLIDFRKKNTNNSPQNLSKYSKHASMGSFRPFSRGLPARIKVNVICTTFQYTYWQPSCNDWNLTSARESNFAFSRHVQTTLTVHLASYLVNTANSFLGDKVAGAWSCLTISSYCLKKDSTTLVKKRVR